MEERVLTGLCRVFGFAKRAFNYTVICRASLSRPLVDRVGGKSAHPTNDEGQISSYSGKVRNSAKVSEVDICSKISAARA